MLAAARGLLPADLVVTETVKVLEWFCEVSRSEAADLARAVITFAAMHTVDPAPRLRSPKAYETQRVVFAGVCPAACAACAGIGAVASFEGAVDRVPMITRFAP